jgi:hypothetical protein
MSQAGRHLRFRALALGTLAVGLLPATYSITIADPARLAGAFFGWAVAMYLFAAFGTMVAALTFDQGEAMRPGWMLLAGSYLVLVPALVLAGPSSRGLSRVVQGPPWTSSLASIVSGALAVTGLFLLSRAWRASGLDNSSRAARVAARLAALAIAVALTGPELVGRFPAALTGDVQAIGDVVTDLLDGGVFVVAVPVLGAALTLGGGLVAWPWLLLTASLVAWLGYDATEAYGGAAGLDARTMRIVEEVLRALAATFVFSAGVAQRWVMTGPARSRGAVDRP